MRADVDSRTSDLDDCARIGLMAEWTRGFEWLFRNLTASIPSRQLVGQRLELCRLGTEEQNTLKPDNSRLVSDAAGLTCTAKAGGMPLKSHGARRQADSATSRA